MRSRINRRRAVGNDITMAYCRPVTPLFWITNARDARFDRARIDRRNVRDLCTGPSKIAKYPKHFAAGRTVVWKGFFKYVPDVHSRVPVLSGARIFGSWTRERDAYPDYFIGNHNVPILNLMNETFFFLNVRFYFSIIYSYHGKKNSPAFPARRWTINYLCSRLSPLKVTWHFTNHETVIFECLRKKKVHPCRYHYFWWPSFFSLILNK